jgi:activator of HSP90 ATPase
MGSRLQLLLGGVSASLGKKGSVAVQDVEVEEGFLAINVRKKKLIPIFELTLCVRWRGEFVDTRYGNTVVDGEMRTREFNHDDATASATEAGVEEPIWDLQKGLTSSVAQAAEDQGGMERMDRRMRHQALLDKTFLKKCVPEVQRQLQVFLEEVRVK